MAEFLKKVGHAQFAKQLMLLGSGFLNRSLGHSVSCTAFILFEMINRKGEDPWPVLVLLAQYFKSGAFQESPKLQYSAISDYPEVYQTEVRRAVSGSGIVALHHLLTLYAIEKSRHFFEHHEYDHLLTMWAHMMIDKTENLRPVEDFGPARIQDFKHFYGIFLQQDHVLILSMLKSTLNTKSERKKIQNYLIKSVLEIYNGRYNPHNSTGLGASIWVIERFYDQPVIVLNALWQYLDFFFSGINRNQR